MRLLHPSRAKLAAWLEGHELPDVEAHVTSCARCAARLDALAPPTADLRVALAQALQPPSDLVPRLHTGVRKRLDARQDLGLLGQMLGLPWHTARILMDEEPE